MNDREHSSGELDGLVLALLLGAVAVAGLGWLWVGLAGMVFGSGWPHLSLASVGMALLHMPRHLSDPRLAFEPRGRAGLPGPTGFYVTLPVVIGVAVVGAWVFWRLRDYQQGVRKGRQGGARMARRGELRELRDGRREQHARLAVGYQGRRLVCCQPRHSAVAFGPTQSWKSTGLEIPNILEWAGCVIASSAKVDLIRETIAHRRSTGDVLVFDPFGLSGERCATWSPIGSCSSWDAAQRQARRLAWAAQLDSRALGGGDKEFWDALARQYLAPLLLAANRAGKDVRVLLRWIGSDNEDQVREALRLDPARGRELEVRELDRHAHDAYESLRAFAAQPDKTQRSVRTTARTLLEVYQYHAVQHSADGCEITPERVLRAGSTLYLLADPHLAELGRPLFVAMLGELVDAAYEQANQTGGRLAFPLLLALDEAGNAAPLPNLAQVASTCSELGIVLLTMFHDLPQAESTYGREQAHTLINNHRAKLLLPGMTDRETLRYFSGLLGEQTINVTSTSKGAGGRSTSEHSQRVPLRAVDELRQLRDRHALLVYGNLRPAVLRLRLSFEDRRLRRLAHTQRAA
jgi:type IV secretion system protein VirD4